MKEAGTSLHVLVIDDNQGDIDLIALGFEDLGVPIRLSAASNGLEGQVLLEGFCQQGRCPDLILLDLNMPRMNGFELLEHIRHAGLCRSSILVVMTTSSAPLERERSLSLGASRFIIKPTNFTETLRTLADVVREIHPQAGNRDGEPA
jgi:chemotaxis family two-component system response regulator Rcp1